MILRDSPELVWRAAGFTAFAVVAAGSLSPDASPPASVDLLVHVMAYGLIAALFARACWTRLGALGWALATAGGGAMLEGLQALVGRDPSFADAGANLVGALLGAVIGGRQILEAATAASAGKAPQEGEPIIR